MRDRGDVGERLYALSKAPKLPRTRRGAVRRGVHGVAASEMRRTRDSGLGTVGSGPVDSGLGPAGGPGRRRPDSAPPPRRGAGESSGVAAAAGWGAYGDWGASGGAGVFGGDTRRRLLPPGGDVLDAAAREARRRAKASAGARAATAAASGWDEYGA